MSVKTTVKKDLLKVSEVRRVISNVVSKSAKEYKSRMRVSMIQQTPLGTLYEKSARGRGFTRSHKASARGQRPQPDTLTLSSAVQDRKTSEFTATVDIAHRINPENGADANEYAEILVNNLGRVIFSNSDISAAQAKFDFDLDREISRITK